MSNPKDLLYSKSHEWVKFEGEETAKVGITDFAQKALGDLVFVNLPEVGDTVSVGGTVTDVESVKAVSDIYSPLGGTISAVNEELLDSPELLNSDPYGAWLFEVSDISDKEELIDADAYEAFCAEEN